MTRSTLLLAHRGWSAHYPENTCLAFKKALSLPIDGLEFDVQLSADEVPVVIHDFTVDRTTDGTGLVASHTAKQLGQLNAAKSWERTGTGFQKIPTLIEVLDTITKLRTTGVYNVELKLREGDGKELVDAVVPIVESHVAGHNVLFSSFHHECLHYLKMKYPKAKVGLLFGQQTADPWHAVKELNAYSANLDYRLTTDSIVAACHQHGVQVCVWTVDDREAMASCIRQPVDLLITNVPNRAYVVREEIARHREQA
jgi:glycerophosphoryl diester phosphodiesterase